MLTDTTSRAARPKAKAYKLSDSGGLDLFITPLGSRLLRLNSRLDGVEKVLSFRRLDRSRTLEKNLCHSALSIVGLPCQLIAIAV